VPPFVKPAKTLDVWKIVSPIACAALTVCAACGPEAPLGRAKGAGGAGSVSDAGPDASSGGSGGTNGDFPDSIIAPIDVPPARPPCEGSTCDAGINMPAVCGDGKINRSDEKCDDGNTMSGDGCTANCLQIEANYVCPTPGQKCVSTIVCGDGKISAGAEACDDSNTVPGDGCSATCQQEPGFTCTIAGAPCESKCGDGILVGKEECEFYSGAPPVGGNGCAANCTIEPGWECDAVAKTCSKTICGNNVVERWEQCDDGNAVPFDGCYECLREPGCGGAACDPICGDGKRYNSEDCDDGNSQSGDGCSATCRREPGYTCVDVPPMMSDKISLPTIFRDFIGQHKSPERQAFAAAQTTAGVRVHPDFNFFSGSGTMGVVAAKLGADRLPVYVVPNPGEPANYTGKTNFDLWYRDDAVHNRAVLGSLDLMPNGTGLYVFDSPFFGPVDGKGFVPALDSQIIGCGGAGANHNFSFTTEAHFWFEYAGGEQFDFMGDDDVWVFVNNTLVIDLGGLHSAQAGSFTLDATTQGIAHRTRLGANAGDIDLKMVFGSVYEVDLFHAERQECGSNFKLTLKAFNKPKSQCKPFCGDAIVTPGEICDDGTTSNTGMYGRCTPDCRRGPYCGDAIVDPAHEQCDDGVNLSQYGGCAPGCIKGPFCGDGVVQSGFEDCDDGILAGNYNGCDMNCRLGPRCGDGIVQMDAGEQCDDGNRTNGDGCNADCRKTIIN
jgi:fibro-slime domain-containing protein